MTKQKFSYAQIEAATLSHFQINRTALLERNTSRRHFRQRAIVAELARRFTTLSSPQIGARLARDHSSVLHAIRRARDMAEADFGYSKDIAAIEAALFAQAPAEAPPAPPPPKLTREDQVRIAWRASLAALPSHLRAEG